MSRNRVLATVDFIKEKVMNFIGRDLENVSNRTGYRRASDFVEADSDLQSRSTRRRVEKMPLVVGSMVGRENLENLETIMGWIADDKIDTVGVFGMGGCGKTTLAMHVYNRLLESDLMPIPVWVTVGVDFNVERLQRYISQAVGLDLENEKDENRRAGRLHNFLSKRGRYVVILDDMWEYYSLQKLGIPSFGGCKVIITTRILSVCKRFGCQKTIKIGMLGVDEAWHLFRSEVGHAALAGGDMMHIAQLLCRECDGLPLAITELASRLKEVKDLREWRSTSQYSRGISTEHVLLMSNHLFWKLQLSYSRLTSATVKNCFLYCPLYPEDCDVQREELIRLWIAEGLIDGVSCLQTQYDKGHTIINYLVDHCLLDSSENGHCVKMHYMIRIMALKIKRTINGPWSLARPGAQLQEFPEVLEFVEDLHAVSLAWNSISEIPSGISLKCAKLSILLLQHNPLESVPDYFLSHTPRLRVLDLSDTSITRLPDSVCKLENLQSLLLHCCKKLIYVPSLANLKALQILDLGYSAIGEVPSGMKELAMLRELDLSGFSKLKEMDKGILSMLPSLKRISCYMVGVLQELQNLKSLEVLDVTFHSISDFNSYVRSQHWRVLNSFHLRVGDTMEQCEKVASRHSNVVSLRGCSLASERGERLVLPDNLLELYIDKCKGLGNLPYILASVNGPDIKDTSSCKDVNWASSEVCNSKENSWSSDLTSLKSSKHLLDSVKGGLLLSNLEICIISRCHDIEKMFTPWQIMGLQNLQVMTIRDCIELKELITEEKGDGCLSERGDSVIRLPNLKILELQRLPMLSNIYSGLLLCTTLQSIQVVDCGKLTQLPFSFYIDDQHKSILPTLEKIEGQDDWWGSLELYQSEAKSVLQTVFRQISSTCSALEPGGDTVTYGWR